MSKKIESSTLSLSPSDQEPLVIPADEVLPVVAEIDNLEEEEIGEAVLKDFVPGQTYFDYQDILNKGVANATDKEGENRAIYNAQIWLLCQVYEVALPDGKRRPLGLDDIACLEGEELAFRISDVMSVSFSVNFLDNKDNLKDSWFFEVTSTGARFRVQKLSVEKGIDIQKVSQADPTGVKLTRWLITQRITINDEQITEEDFKTKIDFATTVLMAQKIDFLLRTFQRGRTSFSIRSTRAGTGKI